MVNSIECLRIFYEIHLIDMVDNRLEAGNLDLFIVSSSNDDRDMQKVEPISFSCLMPK